MAFEPSVAEESLLITTFSRDRSPMTMRERFADLIVGAGFAAAVVVVWIAWPPHGFSIPRALLCLGVLVVATKVRFDTPFGFTVATQLAFVPLLFAMPVAIVPLAVVVALVIVRLPDLLAGRIMPSRLLQAVGNSWFAVGPVAVFAIARRNPTDAGPAILLAALAAQFLVDFTVSTVRFAIGRGASLSSGLSESWVYAIDAALSTVALAVAEEVHTTPIAALAPLPLLALLAMFAYERRGRLEKLIELSRTYRGTAQVLADVLEADDAYTGEHSRGIVALTLTVADQLGLDARQRRNLEFGALLHDIGKISIPNSIINKPGALEPDEWAVIKTHTIEGQRMLDRVGGFMRDVGLIVRSHHERWDGTGYPDGLAGDEIPIEARIIACCDSWNAMRTNRAYRRALSHDVALTELVTNRGAQFDPRVVDVVIDLVGRREPLPVRARHEKGSAATSEQRLVRY